MTCPSSFSAMTLTKPSNGCSPQFQVVGQEHQDLPGLGVMDFNPSKRIGAFLDGLVSSEFDHFIFEDVTVLRNFPLSNDVIESVVLHAGDEVDALGGPSAKQSIVVVPPVINHDGPGIEMKLMSHLDV